MKRKAPAASGARGQKVSRQKQHKGRAARPQSPTPGAGDANSLASLLAQDRSADNFHIGPRRKWLPRLPKLPAEAIGRIKWEIGDAEFFFSQRSGGLPKSDPAVHDRQLEPLISDWASKIYRRFLREGKQALSSGIWTREEFGANAGAFLVDVAEVVFQKLEAAAILPENRTRSKASEIVQRLLESEDLVTLMRSAKLDLFREPAKSEEKARREIDVGPPGIKGQSGNAVGRMANLSRVGRPPTDEKIRELVCQKHESKKPWKEVADEVSKETGHQMTAEACRALLRKPSPRSKSPGKNVRN
jgi:hypothetical protein